MKNIISVLAVAFLLFATTAIASEKYIGIQGESALLSDSSVTAPNFSDKPTAGFGVSAVLGSSYSNSFRFEGELGYRQNGLNARAGKAVDADSKVSSFNAMVNSYYDVKTKSGISPYVGAGVGAARVTLDIPGVVDASEWAFAYQGMAGVIFPVTSKVNFDFGYKYFATQDINFNVVGKTGYKIHNVGFGLKYSF